ncbi:F390 synthetase-related protein [Cohnella faecalis]|uniref:F390 synthetase-related protein n=2 Tax=Cohnella faecalis TaxID=2315694 RepID=UPI00361D24E7
MKGLAALLMQYIRVRYGRRWSNREAFGRWQERQVLRQLRYVQANSPYYRELWGDRPLTQWRQFPAIDKAAMMKHFDRLNTAGIRKEAAMEVALKAESSRNFHPRIGDITVGLSSGTSGSRGLFLVSEREQAAWSGTMLAKLLPGPLWKAEKVAFFLRANSNLYESVRSGKLQFEYFDLLEPIERHVERLNDYRPGIWAAPPSVLRMLAEKKREGQLTTIPHRIISVAEVLDPIDAAMIQETFGLPLHQVYQCTEGFLASTCRYGTLHLNEDVVHIEKEYVQGELSARKFVPIVTDFSRTTQPIIRYRLNDVLTEAATPCPCGSVFTAIEQIEGRCDDIFYMESAADGRLTPIFPDYMTRAILAASPAIEEYRVVQQGGEELEIELLTAAESDREEVERQVSASIGALMRRLNCRIPNLAFAAYSYKPGLRKLRRVERRWQIEHSHLPL